MKAKELDAVEFKRTLQARAEKKLAGLSEREQLEFLRLKFGHLSMAARKPLPKITRQQGR